MCGLSTTQIRTTYNQIDCGRQSHHIPGRKVHTNSRHYDSKNALQFSHLNTRLAFHDTRSKRFLVNDANAGP